MDDSHHKDISAGPLIAGVVFVVIVVIAFFVLPGILNPTIDLHFGSAKFKARTATTETERANGIFSTTKLGSDQALVLAFPSEDKLTVAMADIKVPSDILWLNREKKVVYIVKNIVPDEVSSKVLESNKSARYIVQLASGSVDSQSINGGSTAAFTISDDAIK